MHEPAEEWNATRCMGGQDSWWGTVSEILLQQHDRKLLVDHLRLAPPCQPPVSADLPYIQEDIDSLKSVIAFSNALSSRVAWSQMMFRMCLPHGTAFMVSRSLSKRTAGMALLKNMIEALVKAQDTPNKPSALEEILSDIFWSDEALPIEIMALCMQSNYDTSCPPLRRVMIRFFAGSSTTADTLERCFAHLTDIVSRQSKNKKSSPYALWFYASAAPYTKNCGMEQSMPNPADWPKYISLLREGNKSKETKLFNDAFKPSTTTLPTTALPGNAAAIQKKRWRTCGPTGHFNAAAAMGYLLSDAPLDFANSSMAWAGRFWLE